VEEVLGHPRVREATAPDLLAVRTAAQTLLHDLESEDRPRVRVARTRVPGGNGRPEPPAKAPPPTKAPPPPPSGGEAAQWQQIRSLAGSNRARAKSLACQYATRYAGTPNGRQAAIMCRMP
jgi:hypothetical protein